MSFIRNCLTWPTIFNSPKCSRTHNHFHNILRLFYVLPNFPFTTSETMCDYYLQTWYMKFASRVAERLNDTLREKPVHCWIQYKNWLKPKVGCPRRPSHAHTHPIKPPQLRYRRCPKNATHRIDSKNEWLPPSVTLTANFELVFVLTFENAFSFFQRIFILKPAERA